MGERRRRNPEIIMASHFKTVQCSVRHTCLKAGQRADLCGVQVLVDLFLNPTGPHRPALDRSRMTSLPGCGVPPQVEPETTWARASASSHFILDSGPDPVPSEPALSLRTRLKMSNRRPSARARSSHVCVDIFSEINTNKHRQVIDRRS